MSKISSKPLNPVSFLQAFIVQSLRVAVPGCPDCGSSMDYVARVGLAASGCLEEMSRNDLGYCGSIDHGQYAELISKIKNKIGGQFERVPSEMGSIRVVNHRCPFGDVVKEAPELCRMTSSVFGAVAARNFGYAKVELYQRIAKGDERCDVRVHFDPELAAQRPGDEYTKQGDQVMACSSTSAITCRLEEKLPEIWCSPDKSNHREKWRPIVAESEAMRRALHIVEVVAPTTASVLITGETGVGKEVIARSVHALSDRADEVFLAINCGAIPENLIESTLFGHEKGAFTDAHQAHQGYFERADRGTLFLDEIDSLPLLAQTRLLRVLQEGEYERVGGRQVRRTDVRIIAATNSTINTLVVDGKFREDLYYRINVVPIHIPPLRERPEDMRVLTGHILGRLADRYGGTRKALGSAAWNTALAYHWPGNLRELENVLERAYLFSPGETIDTLELNVTTTHDMPILQGSATLREVMKQATMQAEARVLEGALSDMQGNVSAVARQLGVTPRAVQMKLKSHGIDAKTFRKTELD